ncbi:hypothetical protein L6452_09015 [Arctium lappa]|uniref:Uncharacterized protein n=1 Tax=Arctium lappa TaxID=4217 RepID=A0ACB9DJ74_ARCLA|nr:hypothetical protein L6452_09015 [Arctium lappa]
MMGEANNSASTGPTLHETKVSSDAMQGAKVSVFDRLDTEPKESDEILKGGYTEEPKHSDGNLDGGDKDKAKDRVVVDPDQGVSVGKSAAAAPSIIPLITSMVNSFCSFKPRWVVATPLNSNRFASLDTGGSSGDVEDIGTGLRDGSQVSVIGLDKAKGMVDQGGSIPQC